MIPIQTKPVRIIFQTQGGLFRDSLGVWWTINQFGWVRVMPIEVRS
jgi:hypothetical protein